MRLPSRRLLCFGGYGAPGRYRIVTDGLSVSHRRDAGTPCDYLLGGTTAITERLNEVLTFFGYASQSNPLCSDPTLSVGISPEETPEPRIRTGLGRHLSQPAEQREEKVASGSRWRGTLWQGSRSSISKAAR